MMPHDLSDLVSRQWLGKYFHPIHITIEYPLTGEFFITPKRPSV